MQMLKTILAEHPFFKGLDQSYLNVIVGCAGNVRFDSGDYILRQGEEADHFYLIRQGRVVLEAVSAPGQKPITIQTIGEGDVLGWSWLFPPYRWHLDARAVAPTEGIALHGKFIRTRCEADHDLGYELMKRFAYLFGQRLQATELQLLDLYAESILER